LVLPELNFNHLWQVVLLFSAVFAIQAATENDDPLQGVPFDLYENSALSDTNSVDLTVISPLVSALGSLSSLGPSNREQNLADLKNGLPPNDFETVNHAVKALDKAYETLKPAFPALTKSLTTLYKALPALSSVVSKYQKAAPQGTGLVPKGLYEDMVQLFPVLNEVLEQLTTAFPILAETLTILTNELPQLLTSMPTISRYILARNAGFRSQLVHLLPAYGKAADVFSAGVTKFNENALPALMATLSSTNSDAKTTINYSKSVYNPYYPVNVPEFQQYQLRYVYA